MITIAELQRQAPSPRLAQQISDYTPKSLLGKSIFRALPFVPDELAAEMVELLRQTTVVESQLGLVHMRFEGVDRKGKAHYAPIDYGIVSRKVVTDAGVNFLVDAFQNTVEVETLKFHAIGTGTNAENVSNTGLQTELTTQYNPDNTRATGSLTEGASANIFRTVGTNAVDASVSITEHAIMSQAATGGGTCWDRSVFTAVALASGDSLQSTYDLTCTSGG